MRKKKQKLLAALAALALLTAAYGSAPQADAQPSGAAASPEAAPPAPASPGDGLPRAETRPSPETADAAERVLAAMTREEKVWQLMVLFPEQLTKSCAETDAAVWAEALEARPVCGVVFDGDNITSEDTLRAMLASAGDAGRIPPLLCVDEEGGEVARVSRALGVTTKLDPMFSYRAGGAAAAYENARTIGGDIAGFGFRVDFAPVADVWTNPKNTVIGTRAYSDDPAEAAELVAWAVRGFCDAGVIPVLKHFPGHGDTAEDSHRGAAVCGKSAAELAACELLPFRAGIDAGAEMVMVGHITLPQLDPGVPATLSNAVVTGVLRETLGFDGVVMTDALKMDALRAYNGAEAARLAIEAGCDLLLVPGDPDAAAQYLLQTLSDARLDESVRRILRLKAAHGLLPAQ